MGCTSSKKIKKHTSSVEDVSQQKETPLQTNDVKPQSKNGQISNKQTNAIQIPGANKSFLAPDGIPFIDEDVEDDDAEEANVNPADVNVETHNAASGGKAVTTTTITTKSTSSALENGGHTESRVTKTTTHYVETSGERPEVIGQILAEESKINKQKGTENSALPEHVTNNNTSPSEDVAAARIQASFRGYQDRKKVKAMRAEHEHQNGYQEHHNGEGDGRQVITDKSGVQIQYSTASDDDDQRLNSAATKIQANFRGFKTRKELKQ